MNNLNSLNTILIIMALPINIEDLLNKRKVESNRIEFKAGWNPDKIFESGYNTDIPRENLDAVSQKIFNQLENELANHNLQVYVTDIKDIDTVIIQLVNLILQVYLQVWEKAQTDQSLLISDVAKLFLILCKEPQTSNILVQSLNLNSLYKLRRYILEPAISSGYIEMSDPDKPKSSKQSYRLTQLGLSLFHTGV